MSKRCRMRRIKITASAIWKLLYGYAYVLKLVDYLPEHTHKQYNNTRKLYNKANVSHNWCVVQCALE